MRLAGIVAGVGDAGVLQSERTGFGKSDQRVAAEADVGRSALDANALVPTLETVGLDDEREAETATAVAIGSGSGVRFDGADKGGSEFNSQLRNPTWGGFGVASHVALWSLH